MSDFAIDPELRIRANPERVLRCTNDAVRFIREMMLSRRGHQWRSILQRFEAIRDEGPGWRPSSTLSFCSRPNAS
jgi:hypothetical protein